tara:strand:- start:504 stop:677 length:174 start_codon:yes stop_codon:yes gene_type:complete
MLVSKNNKKKVMLSFFKDQGFSAVCIDHLAISVIAANIKDEIRNPMANITATMLVFK